MAWILSRGHAECCFTQIFASLQHNDTTHSRLAISMTATLPRRSCAPFNKRILGTETAAEAAARKHKARQDQLAAAALHEQDDDGAVGPLQWPKRRKQLRVAFSRGLDTTDEAIDSSSETSNIETNRSFGRTGTAAPPSPAVSIETKSFRRRSRMPFNPFKPPSKTPPSDTNWLKLNDPDAFAAFERFAAQHESLDSFSKNDLPGILKDDHVNGPWEEIFVTRQDLVNRPWPVNRIRKWVSCVDDSGNKVVSHCS